MLSVAAKDSLFAKSIAVAKFSCNRPKLRIVTSGSKPRRVIFGPSRGIIRQLDLTYQTQSYLGLAEAETHKALNQLSLGIKSAVDIGAHSGEYLLFLAVKTSATRIIGIEPDMKILGELETNLKLNHLDNDSRVEIYHKFVSSTNSQETMTLDSINSVLEGACFIKIDVDGGEANILLGASEMLRRQDVRWLIETHSKDLENTCSRVLANTGYKVQIIPNAWWRVILPEQRPGGHNRWLTASK